MREVNSSSITFAIAGICPVQALGKHNQNNRVKYFAKILVKFFWYVSLGIYKVRNHTIWADKGWTVIKVRKQ